MFILSVEFLIIGLYNEALSFVISACMFADRTLSVCNYKQVSLKSRYIPHVCIHIILYADTVVFLCSVLNTSLIMVDLSQLSLSGLVTTFMAYCMRCILIV